MWSLHGSPLCSWLMAVGPTSAAALGSSPTRLASDRNSGAQRGGNIPKAETLSAAPNLARQRAFASLAAWLSANVDNSTLGIIRFHFRERCFFFPPTRRQTLNSETRATGGRAFSLPPSPSFPLPLAAWKTLRIRLRGQFRVVSPHSTAVEAL